MVLSVALAFAVAGILIGLLAYGSLYALWANLRWPAKGRFVRAGGVRLHVAEAGAGPEVVCLHGASANLREFGPLAALLAPEFRVARFDRPGHGHSGRGREDHRLAMQAQTLAAGLEAIGIARAVLVGHSYGAAVALRLALDRPDLAAGLVLIAPASHPYPGTNAWHTRLAAQPLWGLLFSRLLVPLFAPIAARGAIANTYAPADPPQGYARQAGVGLLFRPKTFRANAQDVAATKREFEAQYFRYDEIDIPAIVITADLDAVVSPRIHARALARTLPKAELITAAGAGHMPHRLRPEAVVAAVRRVWTLAAGRDDG